MDSIEQKYYQRKSIRLKDYDYSQPGGYFVTIVTQNKECVFGEIVNGNMILSSYGEIIDQCWNKTPNNFYNIELDSFQIMPNHIHGIIHIVDNIVGAKHSIKKLHKIGNNLQRNASPLQPNGTNTGSLGAIIQNFKSVTSRKINQIHKSPGQKLWQRSFYDHVIRNETELKNVRKYIEDNPLKWELDIENPD